MPDRSDLTNKIGTVLSLPFLEHQKFVVNAILSGGMGSVFQLVPLRPAEPWAMKTFQPHIDRRAFERECETWLSLTSHPNVARALAYGLWQDKPVIVMEWYAQNLSDLDLTKWSTRDITSLIVSILNALDFGHRRSGLVHQDIKPSNILLDAACQPRLGDFGLARCAGSEQRMISGPTDLKTDMRKTVTVSSKGGTPIYMAPELFLGARASVRTDLYSLGVALYEILTDEHPYLGEETGWRYVPHLRQRPLNRLRQQRGSQAEPIIQFIARCVAIDPMNRPSDYMTLIRQLEGNSRVSLYRDLTDQDVIHEAIALAVFYRRQERYEDAAQLLNKHLKLRSDNPELLNALGALRSAEGKTDEAMATFKQATELLIRRRGIWGGTLYLDPLVNFANSAVANGHYETASEFLQVAWSWVLSGKSAQPFLYNEFAWMWLYEGNFDRCAKYLLNVFKHKTPNQSALWWLAAC